MVLWAMVPLLATAALASRVTIGSPTVLSVPAILDGGYWVNVSVGTPQQPLAMLFDVNVVFSTLMYPVLAQPPCTDECEDIATFGSFDPARSRSYEPITGGAERWDSEMYLYSEGSDILSFGSEDVEGLDFRLVPLADEFSAVNELGWNGDISRRLVRQGLTTSLSYSLWNTPGTNEAGVLFGGINTAKYHGPLHCFPMDLPTSGTSPRVTLPINGVELQLGNSTSESNITRSYDFPESPCPVRTADTMWSETYLPRDTLVGLYAELGLSYDSLAQRVELPCSRQTEDHTIIFKIGNTTISTPWSAFITEEPQVGPGSDSGTECSFNIHPADVRFSDDYIGELGPNIIQHMYLVVDEDTEMACVAPLNSNPGQDEILEIGPGPRVLDAVGEFPTTVTRYSPPTPLVTTVTSTQGVVKTAVPVMAAVGIAGVAFVL
ncbi:aspartic peptidase domain-containing protein [Aspergillus pseudoustus]|uniref:Aspartic peptidase domain-containing protein n=1 Tax=Aspergillus pseudoustus TaxID=1810923 RepID=A0ABR4KC27_9EURO